MGTKISMTPQQMFDKAVGGLIKQGCRAMNDHGGCQYRTEEGHKCAFGHCIPDDRYSPNMERVALEPVLEALPFSYAHIRYPQFVNNFTPKVIRFGMELQRIHDNTEDFDEMIQKYKQFAIERGLSLEVFDKAVVVHG